MSELHESQSKARFIYLTTNNFFKEFLFSVCNII